MACFMAHAQSVTIPEVNLAPGGEKSVEVAIPSATNFTAFQFDLDLPSGITVKENSIFIKGQPDTRKIESGTVNGKYRVLSYDTKNTLLTADATLSLTLQASNETGTNEAEIESVVIVSSDGQTVTPDNNNFAINVKDGVEIEFKAGGCLLMVRDFDLDFTSLGDEVKAFIATGYDFASNELFLTRVRDVPAGTPIWVKGPKNEKRTVPTGISKTYYPESFIVGSATESTTITASDDNYLNMTLSPNSGSTNAAQAMTLDPGKAYLHIPKNVPSTVGSSQTINLTAVDYKEAYVTPCDLDFSSTEGLSAYIVTGYTSDGNAMWVAPVKKASANTPLYLKGEKGIYSDVPSSAQKMVYVNMLRGKANETSNVKAVDGDFTTWTLSKQTGIWGPYGFDNPNFPAGKAYLPVPTSYIVLAASRGDNVNLQVTELEAEVVCVKLGSLVGETDGTTGIRELMMNDGETDVWYNLKGQRIDTPTKNGLYIHNGRKVVVK
jgi:hypothetical protein